MYTEIILTLILLVLLWIAVGLQVIASSIVVLGKLLRFPTARKIRQLERNNPPMIVKMVVVKTVAQLAIRYLWRRL